MLSTLGELQSLRDALPFVFPRAIHHTLQLPFQAKYQTSLRCLFVCPRRCFIPHAVPEHSSP